MTRTPIPFRWRRRIGVALLALSGLALIGWRIGILLIERTTPPGSEAGVVCPGTLDPVYARAAERAGVQLRALRAEREIPGLAVAVAAGGRLVWSQGFGYADTEGGTPACPRTQFRIQSVSKLITTAGMARLVEKGLLDLDAPALTYVPGLSPELGAVTARQLASHRAGVRHYRDDNESLNLMPYATATASLEKFRDDPLLFPPDSGTSYSSYGFVLLSAALEGASGLDFPALIRREVFEPLGMSRSEAERIGAEGPDRARFYDNVTPYSLDGAVRPSPPLDFSSKWGGGGILSTVEDLVRFGSAHLPPLDAGFLGDETLDLLFTPRTTRFPAGQGLGWILARDHRLRRVRLHFGAGSGGTSVLAVYPDAGVSIAVLANLGHARFTIPRLLGVANPFVGDRLAPWAWLGGAALIVLALALTTRNPAVILRRNPPASVSPGRTDDDPAA